MWILSWISPAAMRLEYCQSAEFSRRRCFDQLTYLWDVDDPFKFKFLALSNLSLYFLFPLLFNTTAVAVDPTNRPQKPTRKIFFLLIFFFFFTKKLFIIYDSCIVPTSHNRGKKINRCFALTYNARVKNILKISVLVSERINFFFVNIKKNFF